MTAPAARTMASSSDPDAKLSLVKMLNFWRVVTDSLVNGFAREFSPSYGWCLSAHVVQLTDKALDFPRGVDAFGDRHGLS